MSDFSLKFLTGLIVPLALIGGAVQAEIMAPSVGQTTRYSCTGPYGSDNAYKVAKVENGSVRIEITRDGKAEWVEKPVTALGLSLNDRRQNNDGKGVRHQSLDSDVLVKYAKLEPGTKLEFNVRERHDEAKWEWGYVVEVGQAETIKHEVLGEVRVVSITEKRKVWSGSYSAAQKALIVPDKGITIAWTYKDDKGTMDCKLVGVN